MSTADFDLCAQALEPLCAKVALMRDAQLPELVDTPAPPPAAALWSSSYGRLLLWPVASDEVATIKLAADEGEGWLDALLSQAEHPPGIPLDGYLVLALPSEPEREANEEIRKIELSARICRKHLVWPSSDEAVAAGAGPWTRIADVTVLGLPDAVTAAGDTLHWPEIGAEADALWSALQEKGAPAVVQADAEGPIPEGKPA